MSAPSPIGTPPRLITIARHYLPWKDGQPVFVNLHETTDLFLPVFSTADKLREMMAATGIPYESLKQIDDSNKFLNSLPPTLRVIVDPHHTPEGRVHFMEIIHGHPTIQ